MRFCPENIRPGDVLEVGPHRVACGDSTNADHVAALMEGDVAVVLHGDPPYGMKKGFDNDHLRGRHLDDFNERWVTTWAAHLHKYGSLYIWGNPEDLWRWWYLNGWHTKKEWKLANQIIWDKPPRGKMAATQKVYPHGYEACLYVQRNWRNLDADVADYWPGWEPLRAYLDGQRIAAGITKGAVNRLTGTQMAGHWFTRHQWQMITEEHYETLRAYTGGKFFRRPYEDLRKEYEALREKFHTEERPYFDCTHDNFHDVWHDLPVRPEARFGHPTPKPVKICARIARTSAPRGGIVADPFAGSGAMAVACHRTGRIYRGMDIDPHWVATTANRLADEIKQESAQLFIFNE